VRLTPQLSGGAPSCPALSKRIMKWRACCAHATTDHRPLQLLVRRWHRRLLDWLIQRTFVTDMKAATVSADRDLGRSPRRRGRNPVRRRRAFWPTTTSYFWSRQSPLPAPPPRKRKGLPPISTLPPEERRRSARIDSCCETRAMSSARRLTSQFSGRALPCDARRTCIMKWRTCGAPAPACHGPLQLLLEDSPITLRSVWAYADGTTHLMHA
jgi:hypothetical protein